MSTLRYLDFETADDGEGVTTFDALAAVTPEHAPALRAEVHQLLDWAHARFGPAAPLDEGGEWDHALDEHEEGGRVVVSLTLCGHENFTQVLKAHIHA